MNKKKLLFQELLVYLSGLLLLLFSYRNALGKQLYNVDSVYRIFSASEPSSHIQSGRLWRQIGDGLLGVGMLSPIITIVIYSVILFITARVITKIFELEGIYSKLLIYFCTIFFPIINYYFIFGNDIIYYSMSMLFAALAILAVIKEQYLRSVVFMTTSLFSYQMGLSFATSLVLMYFLYEIVCSKENIRKMFYRCIVISVGALIYFILWKFLLFVLGIDASQYNMANQITIKSLVLDLQDKVSEMYEYFLYFTFGAFPYYA